MNEVNSSAISERKLLQLSLLANAFEWYEFSVYGFLSAIIGKLFFNTEQPMIGLLQAFFSLAMGYFARPFGSVFFGMRGDRLGRQHVLKLSLLLMAIPTVLIGFLPTYHQVGISATVALLFLRIVQGFAVGGESPSVACYVFESATPKYKSILCSSAAVGPTIGMLLGSFVTYLLFLSFDESTLLSWAWRIPFFLSIPLSLFIGYFRRSLQETPAFLAMNTHEVKNSPQPLLRPLIKAFCLFGFLNVSVATLAVWMPFYLHHFLHVPLKTASLTNTLTLAVMALFYLFWGYVAQHWSYKRVLIASIVSSLILVVPLFKGLEGQFSFSKLLSIQLLLALLSSSSNGVYVEIVGNLFRLENRCLGISLACTLPATLIGGTVPFVCSYVIHTTGWLLFPAFYILMFALLALPVALSLEVENKASSLESRS